MHELQPYKLTRHDRLTTEVENRTTFCLDKCEFNIFETHRKAEKVKLHFEGFTITSMLRGKKVIHDKNQTSFDYIPGQTLMLPDHSDMIIDFPEARYHSPTQCTALVISSDYLNKHLEYINEMFPREKEFGTEWTLKTDQALLQNDEHIVQLGNRIIKIFTGNDPLKEIMVDIKLKELILSIVRLQNLQMIQSDLLNERPVNERFKAVVEYIRKNVCTQELNIGQLSQLAYMSKSSFYRGFSNEFGITPNQMLQLEKVNRAKVLLANETMSIKDVGFAIGCSDPNYFCRMFRKITGMSPGEYRRRQWTDIN
ncbi:MAG: AraC family transcriptional regulator [Bacteroidia bacterium]